VHFSRRSSIYYLGCIDSAKYVDDDVLPSILACSVERSFPSEQLSSCSKFGSYLNYAVWLQISSIIKSCFLKPAISLYFHYKNKGKYKNKKWSNVDL
jgi:hypothetical protein